MVNLFLILFLVTVIASIVFLINPKLSQIKNRPALSRKTVAIGGTVLSLIFLFIVGSIAPPVAKNSTVASKPEQAVVEEPKAELVAQVEQSEAEKTAEATPKPVVNIQGKELETIKGYNKAILAVRNHGNNVLEIDLPATEVAFTDLDYIDHTSRTTRDILIKILKNPQTQQFSAVRFVVFADLTDQYNNKKNEPIFQLTYDYPEIKKINIDADYVDHRLFLNFAMFGLRSPVAHEMFEGWCGKDDNAERSGPFCQ